MTPLSKAMLSRRLLLTILAGFSSAAISQKMDVPASLERLKENKENSLANLEQYKLNFEITTSNVREANEAIKELAAQRSALKKSAGEMEMNQKKLGELKASVLELKKGEERLLQDEVKKIEDLKQILARLEANKLLREQNLSSYDERVKEIEAEKLAWVEQNNKMGELLAEIEKKEALAKAEAAQWLEKRKHYRSESLKWQKAHQLAEQTYVRFKKLEE